MSDSPDFLICFVGRRDPRPSFGITGPAGEPEEGPVLSLLQHRPFAQVFLICNSGDMFERATQIKLECDEDPELPKVNLVPVEISDIIDHSGIYRSLLQVTSSLEDQHRHRHPRWSVLLDPGTPQMQTAWILLVKSGAFDAALLQGIPPRFNDGVYACREVDLSDEALPVLAAAGEAPSAPRYELLSAAEQSEGRTFDGFDEALEDARLVIRDASTREVFRQAWKVAQYDHEHHLILGETGTGKSELAEWIHRSGPRSSRPFVSINCATLTPTTAESVLFGHKKGAYTGAASDRPGALRSADNGILFLDEIGDLNLELQARLLHVLDGRSFQPMGSDEPVTVDVVVIAATNRDLLEMVEKGSFRQDLYQRLVTVPLTMPPLRERPGDMADIVGRRIDLWNRDTDSGRSVSEKTMDIFSRYHWPGNIRELQQVLKRACMLAPDPEIAPEDLPPELLKAVGEESVSRVPGFDLPESGIMLRKLIADIEKDMFRQALARTEGVAARAAVLVGYEPATFRKALRERYPELLE